MVVIAIIALLLAVLLPSLSAVREQGRTAVCATRLRQLGVAGSMYCDLHGDWLVGSPNTSGNGARPGFAARPYEGNPDHYPALHVFDWANPLLAVQGLRPPVDFAARYAAAVGKELHCPSNRRRAGPVNFPPLNRLIPADALAPSYATSRYFMYVGESAKTGETTGMRWWSEDCVPPGYLPKRGHVRRPANKVFLADAHVVSRTGGQISNANWGFASQGAWRWHEETPVTYRGWAFHRYLWRHRDGINVLAFDGHVQWLGEGDSTDAGGLGSAGRCATWWFPSGTQTARLPSRKARETSMVVP